MIAHSPVSQGRNKDYLQVAINVTRDVGEVRKFIPLVPSFLKPFV